MTNSTGSCSESNYNTENDINKCPSIYLEELLSDLNELNSVPSEYFKHLKIILESEIMRVKEIILNVDMIPDMNKESFVEMSTKIVTVQEKIYMPVKEFPKFNFVGRLLGPRGLTAKQIEQKYHCKLMVRGQGSLRDKKREEDNRGRTNWEHLQEELHVLVVVEDYENRAENKLKKAISAIRSFLMEGLTNNDCSEDDQKCGNFEANSSSNVHGISVDSRPVTATTVPSMLLPCSSQQFHEQLIFQSLFNPIGPSPFMNNSPNLGPNPAYITAPPIFQSTPTLSNAGLFPLCTDPTQLFPSSGPISTIVSESNKANHLRLLYDWTLYSNINKNQQKLRPHLGITNRCPPY